MKHPTINFPPPPAKPIVHAPGCMNLYTAGVYECRGSNQLKLLMTRASHEVRSSRRAKAKKRRNFTLVAKEQRKEREAKEKTEKTERKGTREKRRNRDLCASASASSGRSHSPFRKKLRAMVSPHKQALSLRELRQENSVLPHRMNKQLSASS